MSLGRWSVGSTVGIDCSFITLKMIPSVGDLVTASGADFFLLELFFAPCPDTAGTARPRSQAVSGAGEVLGDNRRYGREPSRNSYLKCLPSKFCVLFRGQTRRWPSIQV